MRSLLLFILILALVAIACDSTGVELPTLAPTVAPAEHLPTLAPTAAPAITPDLPGPAPQPAIVTGVIDGDTIDVDIDGRPYRVRYIGVDTPERGRPFYDEATQANLALVAGQTVFLVKDVSETDRYGRLLRYVYLTDGAFVNARLVQDGYAQVASFPPDVAQIDHFRALQQEAIAAGRGLWSQPGLLDLPPTLMPPAPSPSSSGAPGPITINAVDKRAEFVDLANAGDQPVDLAGWLLLSEKGDQSCPLAGLIQPGATLRVWTLAADAAQGGYNCGFDRVIWNNDDPDPAALYDATGALVDRFP